MKTLLTALLLILASIVRAEPVAVAVVGEVTITLTDEPCRHTDVIDMHYRVTWVERSESYDGCYTIDPRRSLVVAYFRRDRSVALIPVGAFRRSTRM